MPELNSPVYPDGQWAYCVNWTANLAQTAHAAGLAGVWLKWSDGTTTAPYAASWSAAADALAQHGILCVPWLVVYPTDGWNPGWHQVAAAAVTAGEKYAKGHALLLEPVMNWWNGVQGTPQNARLLFSALRGLTSVRPAFCCWGDPAELPHFPWPVWAGACYGVLPEIYAGAYKVAPDVAYNRAFLGEAGQGPGLEQLAPTCPVVPTFDLAYVPQYVKLAKAGGFRSIGWWSLEAIATDAAALEALQVSPYHSATGAVATATASTHPATQSTPWIPAATVPGGDVEIRADGSGGLQVLEPGANG